MCLHPLGGSPELGRRRKRLAHTSSVASVGSLEIIMSATNLEAVLGKSVGQELRGTMGDKNATRRNMFG